MKYARQKQKGYDIYRQHKFKLSKRELRKAKAVFQRRSQRSRSQDLVRLAEIAPNVEVWVKAPNRYDLPGVDTPDAKLVFKHKSPRSQAADLARLAKKAPVEIWIKDTSRSDVEGVDTPPKKRFKVAPLTEKEARKEHEKTEEKPAEAKTETEAEKEPKKGGTPTKAEIFEKAKQLFMEEQARQGLPAITPEEAELKEGGYWEQAKDMLMRSKSMVDSQVLQYVEQLKAELEPMGFTIVPL